MQTPLSPDFPYCSWCALLGNKHSGFLSIRLPDTETDARILAAESELDVWAKHLHTDAADFDGWYVLRYSGTSYGPQWRDYLVEFVGVPVARVREVGRPISCGMLPDVEIDLEHRIPSRQKDTLLLCRARVFYKRSFGYLEIYYNRPLSARVDIKNIRHATQEEMAAIRQGMKILKIVSRRTLEGATSLESFISRSRAAIREMVNEPIGKGQLNKRRRRAQLTKLRLAESLSCSRQTLYNFLDESPGLWTELIEYYASLQGESRS